MTKKEQIKLLREVEIWAEGTRERAAKLRKGLEKETSRPPERDIIPPEIVAKKLAYRQKVMYGKI